MKIRFAKESDLAWCIEQDFAIKNQSRMRNKILQQEIILAEINKVRVGYLRIEYLWGKIPYMSVIEVQPSYQNRGIGKSMLEFLEAKVQGEAEDCLLTSAEATMPEAQAWHKHMGFVECGVLSGLNPDNVDEVFYLKRIRPIRK